MELYFTSNNILDDYMYLTFFKWQNYSDRMGRDVWEQYKYKEIAKGIL